MIGIVVALRGKATSDGDFLVQDILEAGIPAQIEYPFYSGKFDLYFVFVITS